MPLLMKTPVANCSVMDATSTSLIALISIKLYNLPPTKAVTNKNMKQCTTGLSITSMMGVYTSKKPKYHGWEQGGFMP